MIQITKELWVDSDGDQYSIGKLVKQKDKNGVDKDYLQGQKYYGSMKHVVLYVIDKKLKLAVKSGKIKTLDQFIEEHERISSEVENLLKGLEVL